MIEFEIPAISCGHCVRAVTEAVHAADPQAQVQIDLPTRHVSVQTTAPREALVARLVEAGYPPAAPAA
jgi:copper chaperone